MEESVKTWVDHIWSRALVIWCGWFWVLWAWYCVLCLLLPTQTLYSHSVFINGSVKSWFDNIWRSPPVILHLLDLIFHHISSVGDFGYTGHGTWLVCVLYLLLPTQKLYSHSICIKGSVKPSEPYLKWGSSHSSPVWPNFHQIPSVGDFGYSGHGTWLVCVLYLLLPHPKVIST